MVAAMRPLGCSIDFRSVRGSSTGTTLWGVSDGGVKAGIAWDWAEIRPGVVVLLDPMALLANIRITDDSEDKYELDGRVATLNRAVRRLPWHREVRHALNKHRFGIAELAA
jgi:hypothetical protein